MAARPCAQKRHGLLSLYCWSYAQEQDETQCKEFKGFYNILCRMSIASSSQEKIFLPAHPVDRLPSASGDTQTPDWWGSSPYPPVTGGGVGMQKEGWACAIGKERRLLAARCQSRSHWCSASRRRRFAAAFKDGCFKWAVVALALSDLFSFRQFTSYR